MALSYSGTLRILYFYHASRAMVPRHSFSVAVAVQLESFISPRVYSIFPWESYLPRKTSTAHGMSDGNFLTLQFADFALFSTVSEEIRETVSSSGNRFLSPRSGLAEIIRNFHCFCTFPQGRPDAPDVHTEYSKQYVQAQLITTHIACLAIRSSKA